MCLQSHLVDGLTAKYPVAWLVSLVNVSTHLDDRFLAIRIRPCWGGKVDNRTSDFLGSRHWTSCIRTYLKNLATLSISGSASRDGDNGFQSFPYRHLRRENAGCYRVHFAAVKLLLLVSAWSLTSDGNVLQCKLCRHHLVQMCRHRFTAIREL